jgi:hypothetical protein
VLAAGAPRLIGAGRELCLDRAVAVLMPWYSRHSVWLAAALLSLPVLACAGPIDWARKKLGGEPGKTRH